MNDDTILTLGAYAKGLLGDERFTALTQLYGQQCAADMLNTLPHETKKREGIHAAYTGFNDYLALISKFAEAYETLLKQGDLDNQNHE